MNDLIKSVSIENLLQKRTAILERFAQMQTLATEIKELGATFGDSYPPRYEYEFDGHRTALTQYYSRDTREEAATEHTKAIDRIIWKYLMVESGHLTLMDAKAKEDWFKSLKEGNYPEVTFENIAATFTDLHANRGDMFDRGVINVFKSLSWHYKTNSPFKLTKRLVVEYMRGYHSTTGASRLDDLMRCFLVLDNKPVPADYSQTIQGQVRRLDGPQVIDNDYLTVKIYKNGNGHVLFKRMDLVEKLNSVIARNFPFHLAQDNKQAA